MNTESKLYKLLSSKNIFLLLLLSINTLLHVFFLDMPPRSQHVWRQCNTLAVARNFYEGDMNIFRPRVDRHQGTDGVTGMQFPSYEFAVAGLYHIFGEHHFIHRLTSLLIFSLGIWGMYVLMSLLVADKVYAAFTSWIFTWSPLLFYHSINALPDVLALTFSIWGLVWFLKWENKQSFASLLMLIVCLTFAGLTKLQFLAVGFPIAVWVIQGIASKKYNTKAYLSLVLTGMVSTAVPIYWYWYANKLIKVHYLKDFTISVSPLQSVGEAFDILQKNLISDIPEFVLNYSSFILFIVALVTLFKNKLFRHKLFLPIAVWSLGLAIFHLAELGQMKYHGYYMMVYMPVLAIIAAAGAGYLLKKNFNVILIILLIAQPILASARIIPARWMGPDKQVPVEFTNEETLEKLRKAVPNNASVIMGVDISGCIYLYFTHKEGFGFEEEGLIDFKPYYIEDCILKGAEYMYIDNERIKSIVKERNLGKEIKQVRSFTIYKLHPQPAPDTETGYYY